MTELATRDLDGAIAVPDQPPAPVPDTLQKLQEWGQTFQSVAVAAEGLASSPFVPDTFRGKPAHCTAAIMAGMELGISPMASLQAFDVIQGKAAPRAITIAAVLQSRGHQMEIVEWDDTKCVMRGRRKGEANWQPVEWTLDRAAQLGLTGKDQWKKQPKTMLRWRATAELGRILAADALLGIPHSAEELRDMDPVEAEVVVTTTAERTAGKSLRDIAAEKGQQEPAAAKPEASVTQAQLTKLAASMSDLGITDRAQRLAYVRDVIGRDVTSSKELTKAEASRVIEALQRDIALEPKGADLVTQEPPTDPWAGEAQP